MSRINTVSMEKFKWREIYVVINYGSDSYSFCCRGQLPLFNGHQWKQYIDRMNKENPDVVLIVGDFVDDDTAKDDMIASCKAMSDLNTKYGVYYVFGNHDKGYYGDEYRGYGYFRSYLRWTVYSNQSCGRTDRGKC